MKPLQKDCCIFRGLCNYFCCIRLLKSISGSNIPLVVILLFFVQRVSYRHTFWMTSYRGQSAGVTTDFKKEILLYVSQWENLRSSSEKCDSLILYKSFHSWLFDIHANIPKRKNLQLIIFFLHKCICSILIPSLSVKNRIGNT